MVVMQLSIVRRQAQTFDKPFVGRRVTLALGRDKRQMTCRRQVVGLQTMGDQILGKGFFVAPAEAPQPGPGIMSPILKINAHDSRDPWTMKVMIVPLFTCRTPSLLPQGGEGEFVSRLRDFSINLQTPPQQDRVDSAKLP